MNTFYFLFFFHDFFLACCRCCWPTVRVVVVDSLFIYLFILFLFFFVFWFCFLFLWNTPTLFSPRTSMSSLSLSLHWKDPQHGIALHSLVWPRLVSPHLASLSMLFQKKNIFCKFALKKKFLDIFFPYFRWEVYLVVFYFFIFGFMHGKHEFLNCKSIQLLLLLLHLNCKFKNCLLSSLLQKGRITSLPKCHAINTMVFHIH